jgi:hypothetical protein
MYQDVKEIYSFIAYAQPELEELKETGQLANMNNVMAYYNGEVKHQLEEYVEMSKRAYSHDKWMKSTLKGFDKLWDKATDDVESQENLIEERREFIDEVVEVKKTRNEEFYELMSEATKEWKTEFKKK